MSDQTATLDYSEIEPLLRECGTALRRIAEYRLPEAMDQRLLWLGENKEKLTEEERSELLALAEFAEERTLERVQAKAILKRLEEAYPHVVSP